jgi:hypothetical protein
MHAWRAPLDTSYTPNDTDRFILIDVADPEVFDHIVALDRIDELIDHRPGFQAYWQERLGNKADTEMVGAACTKIFERWRDAGLLDKISQTSARLLMCGILDNTLNFNAEATTDRDRTAYTTLAGHANLPKDWPSQYFNDCQVHITADLPAAIRGDFRKYKFSRFPEKIGVGQLVIWDGEALLDTGFQAIEETMPTLATHWFMNVISISEKKNYLLCHEPAIQAWLADILAVRFRGNIAETTRLYLRKEILKQSIEREGQ